MKKGGKDEKLSQTDVETGQESMDQASNHSGAASDESQPQGQQKASQEASLGRVEELTADLQRLQAEFQNYKRREQEAKGALMELAKREVILQLLPVLDNIDRALGHRPPELADNAWANGVEQVAKQTGEQLKKLGVEKIPAAGQPFDHNLHEAIGFEDGDGDQEVVIEEVQPGYKIGDSVIRHSMVRVGKEKK